MTYTTVAAASLTTLLAVGYSQKQSSVAGLEGGE
jgi:hypothetical protein